MIDHGSSAERAYRFHDSSIDTDQHFRLMADMAPVFMWVSNPDMLVTYFNQSRLEFTGRTLEQERGNGWHECIHPEDLDRCLSNWRSALTGRKEFQVDYRLKRSDGQYRWILDRGAPRWMPDGRFSGYIVCGLDVTEMKQALEAALPQTRRSALRGQLGILVAEPRSSLQSFLLSVLEAIVAYVGGLACIWIRSSPD